MVDKYRDQEQLAAVIEMIDAWNSTKHAVDGEPELGQEEPAEDGSDLVSQFRLGWVAERHLKATRDLILVINEAAYTSPAGGVFHAGILYIVYVDEADEEDDGDFTIPYADDLDGYVYRLLVIPQENMINLDPPPVNFV